MSRFVLTAQLQLQAPNNVRQVRSQIQSQLQGVSVNVAVQNSAQAQRQLNTVNNQINNLNTTSARLGNTFGVALRRFTAFAVATRAVSLFANRLASAIDDAIDFQRELVKISQVTGQTLNQLSKLTGAITELSTNLGVSSKSLLSTTRILAQAGIQAQDLEIALAALAKTELAPTFDDITKTAEGAVAILAQFGQGVGALERQLGSINAVAGQFAVESGDLISAIRRTGGVFKSAGGDLNELIALFTSVRATTRESAESIATGLRTIFTRIQRPATIEFLKQFGVELTDLEGKFVGPYDAIRQLSQAFAGLEEGDITFVRIAEELGGFRQIGKVIPLLQQFETAERARQAAIDGGTSLTKDAETAQQALAVQIQKVREEFFALIRGISQTGTFQTLVKTSLGLASALIKVADALKPIIPLIAAFAGFRIARGIGGFAAGLGASFRNPRGFASGGMVPGNGNGDTVPAMLTPGEFVIRKSSVKKLGAGTLAAMNENRYARGGKLSINSRIGQVVPKGQPDENESKATTIPVKDLRPYVSTDIKRQLKGLKKSDTIDISPTKVQTVALNQDFDENKVIGPGLAAIDESIKAALPKGTKATSSIGSDTKARESIGGFAFEKFASAILGVTTGGDTEPFDFVGVNPKLSKIAKKNPLAPFLDAKRSEVNPGKIVRKALRESRVRKSFTRDQRSGKRKAQGSGKRKAQALGGLIQKFAIGGLVASKTREVGAAILDPVSADSVSLGNVTAKDVAASSPFQDAAPGKRGSYARNYDLNKNFFQTRSFTAKREGLRRSSTEKFDQTIDGILVLAAKKAAQAVASDLDLAGPKLPEGDLADFRRGMNDAARGNLFEDILRALVGPPFSTDSQQSFDFTKGLKNALKDDYKSLSNLQFIDAKSSRTEAGPSGLKKKVVNQIAKEAISNPAANLTAVSKQARVRRKAAGGGVAASDTVPALLTPGEFVFNKSAAQSIGYGNLNRMNKNGVQGFAKGGAVDVQRFSQGGPSRSERQSTSAFQSLREGFSQTSSSQSQFGTGLLFAASSLATMVPKVENATTGFERLQNTVGETIIVLTTAIGLGSQFGRLGTTISIATAAAYGLFQAFDALAGISSDYQQAIQGNLTEEKSVEAAQKKANFDLTKTLTIAGTAIGGVAGAAVGSLGAGVGAVPGAVAGASLGAAAGAAIGDSIGAMRDTGIFSVFGVDTNEQLRTDVLAQSSRAKVDKELTKNSEKAAESLKKVSDGSITLKKAFESGDLTGNIVNLQTAITAAQSAVEASKLAGDETDQAKQQAELKKLQERNNKEIRKLLPQFSALAKSTALAGNNLTDFQNQLSTIEGIDFKELDPSIQKEINQRFAANAKAIALNTAALAAQNLGLKGITSAGAALNVELDRIASITDGSFNTLANASATLAASLSGASVSNQDYENSVKQVNRTLSQFGVSPETIGQFNSKFKALRLSATGFEDALQKAQITAAKAGGGDIRKIIQNEIFKLDGLDDAGRKFLQDSLGPALQDLSSTDLNRFAGGDVSVIAEKLGVAGEKAMKRLQDAINPIVEAQNKIVKATERRLAAEEKFVQSQLKSINLQEEGAKIIAEASGGQLDTSSRLQFSIERLSAGLRGGIGSGGSFAGRLGRLEQIRSQVAGATSTTVAAIGGAPVSDEALRQNRVASQRAGKDLDTLIKFSRERVSLYQKELDIVKKKNAQERSALEKLVSGDIEGFIKEQQKAAATSALRSGNASLAGLFSGEARLGALRQLQDEGAGTATIKGAGRAALGIFANQRNVGILTGTDRRSEQARAGLRREGRFLQAAGDTQRDIGGADLAIANAALSKATEALTTAQNNATAKMEKLEKTMAHLNETAKKQAEAAEKAQEQVDAENAKINAAINKLSDANFATTINKIVLQGVTQGAKQAVEEKIGSVLDNAENNDGSQRVV